MTYTIPARVARVDDVASEMTWVVRPDSSRIQGLTSVGALIWAASDGAESTAAVVQRLVVEQGWQAEEISPHVSDFVAQLVRMDLLEESS